MIAIFQRFVDAEFEADVSARRAEHGDLADGEPLARTPAQRRFDALVAIYRSASNSTCAPTASEPLVNNVVDANTWAAITTAAGLASATDLHGNPVDPFTGLRAGEVDGLIEHLATHDADPLAAQRCETSTGVPLLATDVLRAEISGHIRRVVVDAEQVVIDMGRKQRLFTGSARHAAILLIQRCEHVGCELPAEWCEVDHVREWQRSNGGTDQRNAAVLCRHHNNVKHRKRWRTRRALNGSSYTIRDDGTIVLPVGARAPRFAGEPSH